jgi:uncharacterized membrane-anchored protein
MSGRRLIISALVLALVQTAFLSWIIAGRAAILRNGKEVLLKIEPVDPRDLLRGDYIVLGYDISRIPVKLIADVPADKLISDDTRLVVRLKKGADGYWTPTVAWFGKAPSPPAADEADISGHVAEGWDLRGEAATIAPDYGIERFYLPEGPGHRNPERHARASVRDPACARRGRHRADQGAGRRRQDAVRRAALLNPDRTWFEACRSS